METTITVEELRNLCKLIFNKLRSENINSISVNEDYYWGVSSDEAFNMEKIPELAVGSLIDDIRGIKEALKEGAAHSYSELDRLASVLTFISERFAPSK